MAAEASGLAFFVAAIVLAVTPGPGIAYVAARTAAGGRAEGLASCLGTALGGLVHVGAASLGLSVLLVQSAMAFTIVKYVGAAYLVFLGLRLLIRGASRAATSTVVAAGVCKAVRDGMLVEAFNAKTALFFLAFLPQFVSPDAAIGVQLALMGATCVVLNTLVDVLAVLACDRLLRSNVGRVRRERVLARASGITMVSLGLYVALARRGT